MATPYFCFLCACVCMFICTVRASKLSNIVMKSIHSLSLKSTNRLHPQCWTSGHIYISHGNVQILTWQSAFFFYHFCFLFFVFSINIPLYKMLGLTALIFPIYRLLFVITIIFTVFNFMVFSLYGETMFMCFPKTKYKAIQTCVQHSAWVILTWCEHLSVLHGISYS